MFHALIVDDHSGFRGSVSSVLRKQFPLIEVDEVSRGADALRHIQERGADLVLLDIRLPGASGIEVAKSIKSGWDGITVVVLSAFDLPQYRQAAFRNGADCFLYKGSPSCLNDVIAVQVNRRRDVHSVHLRIRDNRVNRIVIELSAVFLCQFFRPFHIPDHDRA